VSTVCGVDVGSLRTPADVAWLDRRRFVFDRYVPCEADPLPAPPAGLPRVECFALDAPQSLPTPGSTRRVADRHARTPTSILPARRAEVAAMRAYGPFVEAGLTIFWAAHNRALPVVETYPRFVIRTLWPELAIPSKRKEPQRYVAALWPRIRALGYTSRPPTTHDEIDAMLCALAAEAYLAGDHLQVGAPLVVDAADAVLREGYIVAPRPRAPSPGPLDALQQQSYAIAAGSLLRSWPRERRLSGGELERFLAERRYCVLATTASRSRPQARPVGFVVLGSSFWFATVAGARLRNVGRTPWVSVVVSDGEGDAHRAVVADGPVTVVERPPADVLAEWHARHGSEPDWAAAWFELRPERLFSYAAQP
jgi:predicted nuclease with RNAse H fold/nitroimidazol reductase NimA-like FMN-containing flavoprotein (pyridoxamine 5'-phosphate oxidase superfamily)